LTELLAYDIDRLVSWPARNIDLLAWFSNDERQECWVCHQRASVTIAGALAAFCLDCGTITIDGLPIKVGATRVA
jgi:hypothetical protein